MPRPKSEYPTELELQFLKVLWQESPLPVSKVQERLAKGRARRELTYSSVITVLNIMVRKKYLKREKCGKAFVYSPRTSEDRISRSMLGDLVDRVFDGSAASVMLSLLENRDINERELKEIRKMINQMVREQSK